MPREHVDIPFEEFPKRSKWERVVNIAMFVVIAAAVFSLMGYAVLKSQH